MLVAIESLAVGTTCQSDVIMFLSQMPWDFWLIFAFLLIVVPWRGRVRLRRLLAKDHVPSKEKITLYGSTIAVQWFLAILVVWRAIARGLTPAELGLARLPWFDVLFPAVAGALVLGGLHWLNLRRIGTLEGTAADTLRLLAARVLPSSFLEMLPYFTLALTAGVCEEFLYRGFGMAALAHAGLPPSVGVVLTALLFGLAHTYQGKSGVVGTTLLGMVLGAFRILLGSLVPLSVWHATIDLVAGVAGKRYLLNGRN